MVGADQAQRAGNGLGRGGIAMFENDETVYEDMLTVSFC